MHAGATVQRTAATLTATLALVAIPVTSAGATEMTAPARTAPAVPAATLAADVDYAAWRR
ncbi:hydrolase, partial [Streptomyces sp. MBT98]|nr:hydrolase [Streptomyces sp. MBT98]